MKLDLGVYEAPNGNGSHAIVSGKEDYEYYSGDINFENDEFNFHSLYYDINKKLYENYINTPKIPK